MLSIPSNTPIYLYTPPADLRKGFDGLSGLVRKHLGDPLSGALFLFVNRRRDRMKILHWDNGGFWLYYRLLEKGTFEQLAADGEKLQIDAAQLTMLLAGVTVASSKRRKRYSPAA